MLDGLKRFIFGEDSRQISPRNLIKPLRDCMERSRKQMPNGTYTVHNQYTIHLSEADYTQLRPLLNDTRLQLEQYLKTERSKRKYGPKGWPLSVEIARNENLKAGQAKIESAFDDPGPVNESPPESALKKQQELPAPDLLAPTVIESDPLLPTAVEQDKAIAVVRTVLVGDLPKTEIASPRRGQLTIESSRGRGKAFDLIDDEITVGREGDIVICGDEEKPQISRKHFTLTYREDDYVLTDTSVNGTFINGVRVVKECCLTIGDVIQAGEVELRYEK